MFYKDDLTKNLGFLSILYYYKLRKSKLLKVYNKNDFLDSTFSPIPERIKKARNHAMLTQKELG
ncbi:hypothetical protein N7931_18310, partial [Catenovulum sp. 2E275]|uniref:hypothetical protein n=1 Tax=Catenovulum sp. 2E275 TaxID=2980497 RepID=UPI0021D1FD51